MICTYVHISLLTNRKLVNYNVTVHYNRESSTGTLARGVLYACLPFPEMLQVVFSLYVIASALVKCCTETNSITGYSLMAVFCCNGTNPITNYPPVSQTFNGSFCTITTPLHQVPACTSHSFTVLI